MSSKISNAPPEYGVAAKPGNAGLFGPSNSEACQNGSMISIGRCPCPAHFEILVSFPIFFYCLSNVLCFASSIPFTLSLTFVYFSLDFLAIWSLKEVVLLQEQPPKL